MVWHQSRLVALSSFVEMGELLGLLCVGSLRFHFVRIERAHVVFLRSFRSLGIVQALDFQLLVLGQQNGTNIQTQFSADFCVEVQQAKAGVNRHLLASCAAEMGGRTNNSFEARACGQSTAHQEFCSTVFGCDYNR